MSADKKELLIMSAAGVIPVSWLAIKLAPYSDDGLFTTLGKLNEVFANPFCIDFTSSSIKMVVIFLLIYFMGIGIYLSMQKNYRRGEEHGSAKWGDVFKLNKKYAAKPDEQNKILSQNLRIGLDGKVHKRNLNVLVIGGSGAGKTRYYAKPNLMQANSSFVILDPKVSFSFRL